MKRLLLIAMALFLAGCSGRMGTILPGGEENRQQQRLTEANALLKKGDLVQAASALDEFIRFSTNATMVAKAKEILSQIRK